MKLSDNIQDLKGVGASVAKKLEKLKIIKIGDLLWHIPYRYDDFSKTIKISDVKADEIAIVKGKITSISTTRTFRKRMFLTQALLQDQSGTIKIVWFNQPYISQYIKKGKTILVAGKAVYDRNGLYINNPQYQVISRKKQPAIIPVYPETKGLSSKVISNLENQAFLNIEIDDRLSNQIRNQNQIIGLKQAFFKAHFPKSQDDIKVARRRLAFEEMLNMQIKMLKKKSQLKSGQAPQIPVEKEKTREILNKLPYKLTNAQIKVLKEILTDISKEVASTRLVQGDVGSGKTIVALIAMANTTFEGYQSVLMAPTEVLATQHYETFKNNLKGLKLSVALLTGSKNQLFKSREIKISKKDLQSKIKSGEIDLVIGTHALISKKMKYKNLGFVVIDEQHRFGVKQRMELREKSELYPHVMLMTATPIPQTMSLTVFGDLDVSSINQMPKGRKKVITRIVSKGKRALAYDFIKKQIKNKKQVFVICPLIKSKTEGDHVIFDRDNKKAAESEYQKLSKIIFPNYKVALLHGKLKPKEKSQIMADFKKKKYDILVSTSVVEVGVDIPDATVMVIEGAENFGLSQLHQFRGRVGRSSVQSHCLLFTETQNPKTLKRLKSFENISDGLKLAKIDLRLRGPGELYGTPQSGYLDLKIANIFDLKLIRATRAVAKDLLK